MPPFITSKLAGIRLLADKTSVKLMIEDNPLLPCSLVPEEKLGDIEEAVGAQDPLLPQDVYVHVKFTPADGLIVIRASYEVLRDDNRVCPNAGVYPTASMNAPVGHRLSHSPNSTVDTIVDRQALGGGAIDEEDMRPIIVNHLLPTSGDDSSEENNVHEPVVQSQQQGTVDGSDTDIALVEDKPPNATRFLIV
eukprot:gene28986-38347_t